MQRNRDDGNFSFKWDCILHVLCLRLKGHPVRFQLSLRIERIRGNRHHSTFVPMKLMYIVTQTQDLPMAKPDKSHYGSGRDSWSAAPGWGAIGNLSLLEKWVSVSFKDDPWDDTYALGEGSRPRCIQVAFSGLSGFQKNLKKFTNNE